MLFILRGRLIRHLHVLVFSARGANPETEAGSNSLNPADTT